MPDELVAAPLPTVVVRELPSSFDQMNVYVDEGLLGLELTTMATQVERIQKLPFETSAIVLARLATHAAHALADRSREIELAQAVYGATPVWPRLRASLINSGARAFAEQHFIALMRLLVLYGSDDPLTENLADTDAVRLTRALIAMGTVNDVGQSDDRAADGWLAYLVQNGAYNHHEPSLEAIARVFTVFDELPRTPGLVDHRDRVPIDEWLREETCGLGLREQCALGMALLASANGLDEHAQPNERSVLGIDTVAELETRVGVSEASVRQALSADRAWYANQFASCDERGASWDRVPFEQRPFLQVSDGRLALWHVRCLLSWLTEGVHYRLLDAARRRGKVPQYTRFVGALTERYAVETVRNAHPGPRRLGVGVVHGEHPYGGRSGREKRTRISPLTGGLMSCSSKSARVDCPLRLDAVETPRASGAISTRCSASRSSSWGNARAI